MGLSLEGSRRLPRVTKERGDIFFVAPTSKIVGRRSPDGHVAVDVYVPTRECLSDKQSSIPGIDQTWWSTVRSGQNPHRAYLEEQYGKLTQEDFSDSVVLADREHPVRWSSGGALIVVEDPSGEGYAMLHRRRRGTNGATYQGHYLSDIAGSASSVLGLLSPRHTANVEILEEITTVHRNGGPPSLVFPSQVEVDKIVRPIGEYFATRELLLHQQDVAKRVASIDCASVQESTLTDITPPSAAATFRVHYRGFIFPDKAILVVDSKTASVETRMIYKMSTPFPLEEYLFIDGELIPDKEGYPRDAEIMLFAVRDLKELMQSGEPSELLPRFSYQSGRMVDRGSVSINPGQSSVKASTVDDNKMLNLTPSARQSLMALSAS